MKFRKIRYFIKYLQKSFIIAVKHSYTLIYNITHNGLIYPNILNDCTNWLISKLYNITEYIVIPPTNSVTCLWLNLSSCSWSDEAPKTTTKMRVGRFFSLTVDGCSSAATLGSVERIFPCDLQPELPQHRLKTHTHTESLSHFRTRTNTHLRLFPSLIPALSIAVITSSCPLHILALSGWLTANVYRTFVLSRLLFLLFITNSWVSRDFVSVFLFSGSITLLSS